MFKRMVLPIGVAVVLIVSAIVGGILIINNVNNYGGKDNDGSSITTDVGLNGDNHQQSGPVHSHKFDKEPIYSVDGDIAYVSYACSNGCDERSENKALSNAVVATPSTIQDVLDTNINGKFVVLSEGVYEHFELRPSLANVQTIRVDTSGGTNFGEPIYLRSGSNFREISEVVQDVENYNYLYEARFENITIVGVEGAVLRSRVDVVSGEVNYMSLLAEDPIRGIQYTQGEWKHTTRLTVKNLKLQNLKFNGIGATINIAYNENNYEYYDGISIENCALTTVYEGRFAGSPAIRIDNAKNVNIIDCNIIGHFYGVYTTNVFNLDCSNNTIKQLNSNAIVLQSGLFDGYFMGSINICSNHIEDIYGNGNLSGDRAIYMKNGKHSIITIKDNTFVNAINAGSQVAKVFSLENSLFSFVNNNYYESLLSGGKAIDNIANSAETSFEVKVS